MCRPAGIGSFVLNRFGADAGLVVTRRLNRPPNTSGSCAAVVVPQRQMPCLARTPRTRVKADGDPCCVLASDRVEAAVLVGADRFGRLAAHPPPCEGGCGVARSSSRPALAAARKVGLHKSCARSALSSDSHDARAG